MTLEVGEDLLRVLYPAFLRTDLDGRLTSVGPAITRHVPGAAPGRTWSELFSHVSPGFAPPETVGGWVQTRIRANGAAFELTGAVVREADGLTYLLSPSVQDYSQAEKLALDDFPPGDGGIANMITISLQRALIVESQTLVAELADARAAAEAALQSQTHFLNGVSHGLRTPLASLVLCADLLDSRGAEAGDDFAERFRDSVLSLKSQLDNLIDFSALRTGRVKPAPHWCDGHRLLAGLAPLRDLATRRGVQFACDAGGLSPQQFHVDGGLLDQLLQSLVQNAIEAAPGGRVEVRLADAATDRLRAEVRHSGADAGASETPDPEGQAFSVGLAVAREIVTLLHGDIGIDARESSGSTVWFELPVERRP